MSASLPADSPAPRAASPFAPDRPFLRQDGLERGMTKHALDGPTFSKLFGSVRVAAHVDLTPLVRARSAVLVVPAGVVSHHTAAALWGGVVPDTTVTHVSVGKASQRRAREALHCHVRPALRHTRLHGLAITTPAQTFVDMAASLDLVDLVVLGDSLITKGVVRLDELLDATEAATGRGAALAREAAGLVRAGAESPMETRVRLLLHFAGLPEPVCQLGLDDGRIRLDLAWPVLRLAVEYDGRQHAEDARQWGRDLARREWLDANGWRLLVLRAQDVFDDPWATARRVGEALAARGYEKELPADPPVAFATHFPGRPWKRAKV
ncbi:DUF559 domain-containing protein [Ornithinimicrobium humiphilum]|nr:DUF559 domain-containing protein [Ornithinimicrobium humiphilum]